MSIRRSKEEWDKATPAEKQADITQAKADLNAMITVVDTTQFLQRIGLVVFKR